MSIEGNDLFMDMKTNAEEMEKWLNLPIPKRVVKNWKDGNKLKTIREDDGISKIIYSDRYLLWLDQFTLKNPCFSSDILLYCQDQISDEERDMIGDLHLLYRVIDDYANRSNLFPFSCYNGQYYKISYNNARYKIGVIAGQGTHFFARRVRTDSRNDFIDFNVIIEEVKKRNSEKKKKKILKK